MPTLFMTNNETIYWFENYIGNIIEKLDTKKEDYW